MNQRESLIRFLTGGMDEKEMEKMFGPAPFKDPETIFAEAEISGLKKRAHELQGYINTYHVLVEKQKEKIKAAEETESNLRAELDNKRDECGHLKRCVQRHEHDLRSQRAVNESQGQQLADLQAKLAKIADCLNGGLPKKPLASDMKKTLDEIMSIVTVLTKSPDIEQAEA